MPCKKKKHRSKHENWNCIMERERKKGFVE
jgi:hypothetical protein